MHTKRIIPCLDVKDGRVVKGTNFVGLRDAGDPVELASVYDQQLADELVFLDITASCEERDTMVKMVEQTASQIFIPFTEGRKIVLQILYKILNVCSYLFLFIEKVIIFI